jgi:hypothetical protein
VTFSLLDILKPPDKLMQDCAVNLMTSTADVIQKMLSDESFSSAWNEAVRRLPNFHPKLAQDKQTKEVQCSLQQLHHYWKYVEQRDGDDNMNNFTASSVEAQAGNETIVHVCCT